MINKIITCLLVSCFCVQINAAHLHVDADMFMAKLLEGLGPKAQAEVYEEVTGKKLNKEHLHWATCKIEDGFYLKIEWDGTTFFALIGAANNFKKLALINKKSKHSKWTNSIIGSNKREQAIVKIVWQQREN